MRLATVNVTAEVEVADGISPLYNVSTGDMCGFVLPNGAVVKAWLALELQNEDDARDLTEAEAKQFGLEIVNYVQYTVEGLEK